jgi:hypothetical protein
MLSVCPRSLRPGAVPRHGGEFRQHRLDEIINIGKRVPRARRRLCWMDGSAHNLWLQRG